MSAHYRHDATARHYIETHLGGSAIIRRKPPVLHNIGIDLDPKPLATFDCDYPVEKVHGCAHLFLSAYDYLGRELIYCDLPYLHHTRTFVRRYRFDYEEQDHVELLELLKRLPCSVMLSGYPSSLYDELLPDWRTIELRVMNQSGVRTEKLWFNFTPDRVHWPRYAGKRYQTLPREERLAVLSSMIAVEAIANGARSLNRMLTTYGSD